MERKYSTGISIFTHDIQLQNDHTLDHTLGIFGWGCAAGTLEPLAIPELVQVNFATLY